MAVTDLCLSPFPPATTPAKRAAAIEYLKSQCAGRAAESDEVACRLGMAAAELVEREAPGAPQAIKNEACVRMVGYLSQADFGSHRQETIGPLTVAPCARDGFDQQGFAPPGRDVGFERRQRVAVAAGAAIGWNGNQPRDGAARFLA